MTRVSDITRRQLIGAAGVAGAAWVVGTKLLDGTSAAAARRATSAAACVLAPSLTEGPYWVDERLHRSDLRVDPRDGSVQAGVPIRLGITIVRADGGCSPQPGAVVDMWQANAAGEYSDESALGTTGKRYLRGYQITDQGGRVSFLTILPGWYRGRTVHIHVRIRVLHGSSATYDFTTQLFFDELVNNAVLARSPYTTRGRRDTTNAADMIFAQSGGKTIVPLTSNAAGGYRGEITLGLDGLPTTSVDASLISASFGHAASGGRVLNLRFTARRKVRASVRVSRGSTVLARTRSSQLPAGTRSLTLALGSRVSGGQARLEVTFTDASGNAKTVTRTVQIPGR
jgi:protocatechuate 3,4-dioxygenase beta subunit